MLLAVLAIAFALAIHLRLRGIGAALAIPLAAAVVAAGVLFQAFIYPGDPELQQWWQLAAAVGLLFGVMIAGFGYFIAPMLKDRLQ